MKFIFAIIYLANLAKGNIVGGAPHAANKFVIGHSHTPSSTHGGGERYNVNFGATVTTVTQEENKYLSVFIDGRDMSGKDQPREFHRKNRGQSDKYSEEDYETGFHLPSLRHTVKHESPSPHGTQSTGINSNNPFSALEETMVDPGDGTEGISPSVVQAATTTDRLLERLITSMEGISNQLSETNQRLNDIPNQVSTLLVSRTSGASSLAIPSIAGNDDASVTFSNISSVAENNPPAEEVQGGTMDDDVSSIAQKEGIEQKDGTDGDDDKQRKSIGTPTRKWVVDSATFAFPYGLIMDEDNGGSLTIAQMADCFENGYYKAHNFRGRWHKVTVTLYNKFKTVQEVFLNQEAQQNKPPLMSADTNMHRSNRVSDTSHQSNQPSTPDANGNLTTGPQNYGASGQHGGVGQSGLGNGGHGVPHNSSYATYGGGGSFSTTPIRHIRNQGELDHYASNLPPTLLGQSLDATTKTWLIGSRTSGTLDCGVYTLTDVDLEHVLGIKQPLERELMITQHAVIQQRGIDAMTGKLASPLVAKAMAYCTLPDIIEWTNHSYVELWNTLSTILPTYGMGISPVNTYKLGAHYLTLAIPGLGFHRTREIDLALFQLLATNYDKGTVTSSPLSTTVKIIRQTSQSGFELLVEIGKHVVTALDSTVLLERPRLDGDLFQLADHLTSYFVLSRKRGTLYSKKHEAIIFLELCSSIIDTTVMLVTFRATPDSLVPSDGTWDMHNLARQLTRPTSNSNTSAMVMHVGAKQLMPDKLCLSPWPHPPLSNSNRDNSIQGFVYQVNKAATQGKTLLGKRDRVPLNKGFPIPFEKRIIDSKPNRGTNCAACHSPNHSASFCFPLAQASWMLKFIQKGGNRVTVEEAEKNWIEYWKKRNKNGRYAKTTLTELLDVYSAETGIAQDDICDQMAWESFYPQFEQEFMLDDYFEAED
eukprot:scaffold7981_cov96-Skeletonema_menzelii.AAC.1